jgi:hypothetical protein
MAYNPFNIFRRNQKAIFAVITVFIMFTFVLSSGMMGGADFFDWFPNWLRGRTQKGEHLCTVDGTKVYSAELEKVRKSRMQANRFMSLAATETSQNLFQYVDGLMGQISPEKRGLFLEVMKNPRLLPFLAQILGPDSKGPEQDAVRALQMAVMLAGLRATSPDHYFVNAPNRSLKDAADFMLWEKKADQLGIKFTEADVKALIQREFFGQFRDDVAIRKEMSRGQGFNFEACLRAIGTEFKVRAAQTILLGPRGGGERTLSAPPIFTPPYDLFTFYREECSPTTYDVLSLPVEAFIPAVVVPPDTDKKFDDELRELFTKYQSTEPNPASETPGFMDPRKVKLEWVKATGSEKYYQDAARESLQKGTAALQLLPVGPSAWPSVAVAATARIDPAVNQLYESEWAGRHRVDAAMLKDTHQTVRLGRVLDTSVVRPANVGAALLGMGGGLAGFAPPGAAVAPLATGAIAFEVRDRVRSGMAAFLGAVPGPGLYGTLMTGEAAHRASLPRPLSLDSVRADVLRALGEQMARRLMIADLTKLRADVDKLFRDAKDARGRDEARVKAKALIDEFVQARGPQSYWVRLAARANPAVQERLVAGGLALQRGESTGLRSEWTIEDDPGLAPLKAVWAKARGIHGAMPVPFGQRFFWEFDPATGARRSAAGLYRPDFYPDRPNPMVLRYSEPDPVFVTWRTEEKPSRSVAFHEARPDVKAAWVRAKARELARARAEAIAGQIRGSTATSLFEIERDLNEQRYQVLGLTSDPKVQEKVRRFFIRGVAPLAPPAQGDFAGLNPRDRDSLRPFHLAPSTDIPYPTREMEKALLDERKKGVRTVLVLADQPKDAYYVAAVADRQEKTQDDFARSVYGELASPEARDMVRRGEIQESARKATESVLALLRQEFKYVVTDEQKKKLEKSDRESE